MTVKGQPAKALNEAYSHLDILLDERQYYDRMIKYAGKYEISIQFWGDGDTNVFIAKDGIDLHDFGGLTLPEAIKRTVEYLDRINNVK